MAQAIYQMKMMLLMDKITWRTNVERKEVKIMSEFISIFYGFLVAAGIYGCEGTHD